MESVVIQGVELRLSPADVLECDWVGREELLHQLLAAWMVLDRADYPLSPRLVGKPGVGKTTLAAAAAIALKKPLYILQATMDTRPEDLLVTPVITDGQRLRYVASPLVSAMIKGGVCILDEGNRMGEKSWASLAPLLDRRRYVESIIAGIKIHAHRDFRICATMNEDASTFDIPEYIHSRLQPQILIDFPDRDEERAILQANLPFARDPLLGHIAAFLQRAHEEDEPYTVRDGINIARYALKLAASEAERGGPKGAANARQDIGPGTETRGETPDPPAHLRRATLQILGEEALPYLPGEGPLSNDPDDDER